MTAYTAFLKKEWLELVRTGRLMILGILFLLFGIMNPAIAKLTPLMMKLSEESLKESGMILKEVVVNDMTSWMQFLENTTMIMIIFIIMFSASITGECQKGTMVQVFTRGVKPSTVVLAKWTCACLTWTAGYGMMLGITYGYNQYFWGNEQIQHVSVIALSFYVFGLMLLSLVYLMSAFLKSNITVLLGTAAAVGVMYLVGIIPKAAGYTPVKLLSLTELARGNVSAADYRGSFVVTIVLSAGFILLACVTAKRIKKQA